MWGTQGLVSPPPNDPAAPANPVFNGPAAMTQYEVPLICALSVRSECVTRGSRRRRCR